MTRRSAARRGAVAGACAGFLWLAGSGLCDAAERTWTFAGNAFFSDATRWSPNAIPGAADNARFNLANTYSILFATNPTNTLASVTDGDVTFSLGGETYTLTSTGATSLVVGSKSSFPSVLAKLTVSGGTFSDQSASIGNGLFGPGQITVSSATWTNAGAISVGAGSVGTLLINAGGGVTDVNASVGVSSSGTATVGGNGASWTTSGALDIGVGGTGQVTLNAGATMTDSSSTTDAILGDSASGHGTLNVTDGVFNAPSAGLRVGNSGLGTLSVSSGAGTCVFLYAGVNAGSSGTINVSGTGSLNVTGSAFIGGSAGAAGGTGVVNIASGTLNVTDQLKIWTGGTVNLSGTGGVLSLASLTLAGGTLNWTAGRLIATNSLTVGPAGMLPTLNIGTGQFLSTPYLQIGVGGPATATISSATNATSIDVGFPNAGTLILDGASITPNSVLLVDGAGTLSARNDTIITGSGSAILAVGFDGTGTAWMDVEKTVIEYRGIGTNSVSGPLETPTLVVGDGTAGRLRIGGPITINEFDGDGFVGGLAPGTLLIDGGYLAMAPSTRRPNTLVVGDHAAGTLIVQNGGFLQMGSVGPILSSTLNVGSLDVLSFGVVNVATGGTLGSGTVSINRGSISVDGAGSSLRADYLRVGMFSGASAAMAVTNGGTVTSSSTASIAPGNGAGTVTLSGAGSSWTVQGNVDVGQGQSGYLSAGPGTALNIGGTLTIYTSGRLDLSAATFTTAGINFSGGVGTLSIDAGGETQVQPIVLSGATADVTFAAAQHLPSLTINGGHARRTAGVLLTRSLSIIPTVAQLDLTNGDMVVDYASSSPIASIQSWLQTGFAGGAWTGNGIASSAAAAIAADSGNGHKTALGYAEASTLGVGSFGGQVVDTTSVLVGYAFYGDANLDGTVNTFDFTRLAAKFNATTGLWSDGDSNYDGVVNALDFNALAINFGSTLASPALGSVIPEPATIAAIGMIALLCRRRRVVGRNCVEPYHPARG